MAQAGISKRHSKGCPGRDGRRCRCNAGWQAEVYDKREGRKIRRSFRTAAEAKSWRADALVALGKGALRASTGTTVRDAWEDWYAGAQDGSIRNRTGDPFKPTTLRTCERSMRLRVLPEFGPTKVADLTRPTLQEFVNRLLADGLDPATVGTTLLPLRGVLRHAVDLGQLAVNPCDGLRLPAARGRRERVAEPDEAAALIDALPRPSDRAIWATALYAGLRRGELQGLRVKDVDLGEGVIRVERGWDRGSATAPKTRSARRRVPIAAVLRQHLTDWLMRSGRRGDDLLFGRNATEAFNPGRLTARADTAWRRADLDRITLHEARHTFASLMIAAGVNVKALSTFCGHASIGITMDRYGHLLPGAEDEAADLMDAYLGATGTQTGTRLAHDG